MTQDNFLKAMSIISQNHTTEVVINRVVTETVQVHQDNVRLEIKTCCATVINNLKYSGFSLSMSGGHLLVEKF